jgi:cellulose synthase/poly-beta-1,6-N-acetylglucosamine synthase-like glycosyltransferase
VRASESTQALAFVLLIIFLAYVILILVPFLRRKVDPEGDPSLFTWHVLVPCRDEAAVIDATLRRLRQDFPMAHVWVIDDDSDDDTADIVRRWVERDSFVHLVERKRPDARTGKGAALNVGYNTLSRWLPADADRDHTIVAVVDADGILAPNAFRQAAGPQAFGDPATGAAQAAVWMSNRNDPNPLPAGTSKLRQAWGRYLVRMQDIEFRTTIAAMQSLRRHTFSVGLGGNGQFSRLAALDRIKQVAGDPWHGSLLEDYELGIHIMLVGYRTSYMHDTHVEQEALPSTRRLLTQRVRWCQGGMQCTRYLPGIFQSQHFTNAGALEATYFLLVPFIQLLGLVLWPAAFIAMAAAGSIYAGGLAVFLASAWWLLPLIVLTGIVPFAIWVPIYRKQAQPDASIGQTLLWGMGYWLYMYQNYISVIRAFYRLITGKDGWSKTRRNAEEGTKLLARDT